MTKASKICVFYSWQSDLPNKTNHDAIDSALQTAIRQIAAALPKVEIRLDEATRDITGSPNIASKIVEKIEDADIVVADVTTITSQRAKRPCPNPNVVYELGYAVAYLGRERVILLFNEEFGNFPQDLPFDFAQHRAIPYKLAGSGLKSARDDLPKCLEKEIIAIIRKNPKRSAETRGLSREKIEHDRDVQNMEWLMSTIHLPTLGECINDLPSKITDRSLFFHDTFSGVVSSFLFSIYDPVLSRTVAQLSEHWFTALSHSNEYSPVVGGSAHFFSNPGDLPLPPDREEAWDDIENSSIKMREALDAILKRLREDYLEIDIHKMSETAWETYIAYEQNSLNGLTPPEC